MSASEMLIAVVEDAMEALPASSESEHAKEAVAMLVAAHRDWVKSCLRLEETIHKLRKNP